MKDLIQQLNVEFQYSHIEIVSKSDLPTRKNEEGSYYQIHKLSMATYREDGSVMGEEATLMYRAKTTPKQPEWFYIEASGNELPIDGDPKWDFIINNYILK